MTALSASTALFVKDISKARNFYESFLSHSIVMANESYVAYHGNFCLWHVSHATTSIFGNNSAPIMLGDSKEFQLYFETERMEEYYQKALSLTLNLIHPIQEQVWGQRCFRLYDPDDHIIEIAEPLHTTIKRYIAAGISLEEISQKTFMPPAMLQNILTADSCKKQLPPE